MNTVFMSGRGGGKSHFANRNAWNIMTYFRAGLWLDQEWIDPHLAKSPPPAPVRPWLHIKIAEAFLWWRDNQPVHHWFGVRWTPKMWFDELFHIEPPAITLAAVQRAMDEIWGWMTEPYPSFVGMDFGLGGDATAVWSSRHRTYYFYDCWTPQTPYLSGGWLFKRWRLSYSGPRPKASTTLASYYLTSAWQPPQGRPVGAYQTTRPSPPSRGRGWWR